MEEAKVDPSLSAVRTPGPCVLASAHILHQLPLLPCREGPEELPVEEEPDSDLEEEAIAQVLLSASRHPGHRISAEQH